MIAVIKWLLDYEEDCLTGLLATLLLPHLTHTIVQTRTAEVRIDVAHIGDLSATLTI
jgi:hypothetical protein